MHADSASAIKSLFANADSGKKKGNDTTAANGPFSRMLMSASGSNGVPGRYYVVASDQPEIDAYLSNPDIQAALPPGKVLRWAADSTPLNGRVYRSLYVLDSRPIVTGDVLLDAKPSDGPAGRDRRAVHPHATKAAAKFLTETGKHLKDYMAIVLDDRIMSVAVINGAIGTRGQITMGGNDLAAAQDLSVALRAGALPVALT